LCIGDPIAIGIACSCAIHWNKGRCKMLKWDRMHKQYIPISINLFPKDGDLDEKPK